jgi:hypothetical protein
MIVAKVGDVAPGMCMCVPYPPGPYPATGVVMTGSALVSTTGIPIADASSIVMYPCGTSVIIATGVNLLMAARTGDVVTGCGVGTLTGTSTITSL